MAHKGEAPLATNNTAPFPRLQRIVTWARRRWEHGLGGLGLPWQDGEDAWLLAGQLQSRAEEGWSAQAGPEQQDLPPDALADADSRWARCGMLRVHYKLALPLVSACGGHAAGRPRGVTGMATQRWGLAWLWPHSRASTPTADRA